MNSKTKWFIMFLVAGIALRVLFLCVQEPFVYKSSNMVNHTVNIIHDEQAHWNYIAIVAVDHMMPGVITNKAWTDSKTVAHPDSMYAYLYENYQLPAYYFLMSVLALENPQVCRVWNVVLSLMGVLFLWLATKNNYVVAFFMLTPAAIQSSILISNDVLMFTAVCFLTYAMVKEKFWLYFISIVICALTKAQGFAIALTLFLWFSVKSNRKYAIVSLVAALLSCVILLDRYGYSTANTYSWTALNDIWNIGLAIAAQSLMIAGDQVGYAQDYILPIQIVFMSIGAILVYGLFCSLKKKWLSPYTLAAAAVFATWFAFSFTHVHWPDRLLFPMIPFLTANYKVYANGS